jgi:hypothetical protein
MLFKFLVLLRYRIVSRCLRSPYLCLYLFILINLIERVVRVEAGAMYEAVKALITGTSLFKISVITIQQNFMLLPTYVLYEMPLLQVFQTKLALLRNWLLLVCSFSHVDT